ncbi:unnamed protein product [Plutella xylostella]|uniref:(diamondback moth) hypothetical protein n=1 Tax=Plutella xylostella TaxID=51655 RepID=A0A8S4F2K4_PLUXY|nr:unnamed protein product [Plutella xylostella]
MTETDEVEHYRYQITLARSEIKNLRQQISALKHEHQKEIKLIKSNLSALRCSSCTDAASRVSTNGESEPTSPEARDLIIYSPIGFIETSFQNKRAVPRQPSVLQKSTGLQVDEEPINNGTPKTQVSKPPPIVLYGINDIAKLCEVIDKTLQKSQYTSKIVTKNQLRISCDTIDSYKKLMCLTREKGLIGHTFTRKDERPYRIVIKDLHPSTPVEAIREEVESTGNTIVGEIINARYGPEKTPTYTWFVNLALHPKNAEIKKLKYIYHTSVKIEDPKRTSTIAQCKRCQQYGHTRNYCMRPYRCVKCAEDHNTTDCPKKDRTTPAKCALCLGDHPANYHGCKVRLEIQKRKMSRPQLKRRETETNKANFTGKDINTNFPTTETIPPRENYRSYADATIGNKNPTNSSNLETILSKQAEKLDRLIDQMGVLMGLLTTIVTKLIP